MRIIWLFICLCLLTCSSLQAAEKSLFWQLQSPAGHISYLFGTMHTDDNRVTDFPPVVFNALKNVDTFMLEVAESPKTELLRMPQGDLKQMLTETELDQVTVLADKHVMPLSTVLQMKPWLLAVVFDLPKPQTPFAQDFLLKARAEELDKNILGLETPQAHFAVMDSLTIDEQLLMLRAVLKRSEAQKEKDFERLMRAYLSGDPERVAHIDDALTGGILPPALWQRLRVKLLDERNVSMAARGIAQAQQERVFIAVGAAHLAGPTGLLQAFKQAGFKLTPIKK
ncbi:MAG: TraB/GumN family protein [Methylophilus sp.]|uniref:TraB/GumN family protein n=1 Tax=Methylophilus sp. TaxID=29541 RepID=UPI003FA02F40